MIDSSFDITRFLPIELGNIGEYVIHHAQKLDSSIEHSIETGVFFHTHILYMTFIYVQLLRIAEAKKEEFRFSWIGFVNEERKFNEKIGSPFAFSVIKEKTVFRFFRLIGFDSGTIGNLSACVGERNEFAHATGIIVDSVSEKVDQYIKSMELVVDKSQRLLDELMDIFRHDNPDFYDPNYLISADDLRINLLNPYRISEVERLRLVDARKNDRVWLKVKEFFE